MAHELIFLTGGIIGFIMGGLALWRWSRHQRKSCLKKHTRISSQTYSVMQHICQRGKPLDKQEAKKLYGVVNLPSLISNLNKSGSEIRTVRSKTHGIYYSI